MDAEERTAGPGRGEASGSVFPPAVLSSQARRLSHTTDPSKAPTPAVSAIAALAGGFVCASIAASPKAPLALAVVVLVLGILSAIPALMPSPTPAPRQGNIGNLEAMNNARQPAWVALLLPVIGAGGALAGATLKGQTSHTASGSSPA